MTSFRERAAIAFAVEASKIPINEIPINGGASSTVGTLNKAVSIAALQFADTLAAEACAKWGHDFPCVYGDEDELVEDKVAVPKHCARCGATETK